MAEFQKIVPLLWFDGDAQKAVEFYVSLFPDSKIVSSSPLPTGPAQGAPIVSFILAGQEFTALDGGPMFKFSPAISFVVNCESQEEIDHFWEGLSEGGVKEQCGWLRDKFGGFLENSSRPIGNIDGSQSGESYDRRAGNGEDKCGQIGIGSPGRVNWAPRSGTKLRRFELREEYTMATKRMGEAYWGEELHVPPVFRWSGVGLRLAPSHPFYTWGKLRWPNYRRRRGERGSHTVRLPRQSRALAYRRLRPVGHSGQFPRGLPRRSCQYSGAGGLVPQASPRNGGRLANSVGTGRSGAEG